ncbi:MAG TPA: TetR/AcrR family transcriptional regulator [Steroidobacteraceae bacterium]|jgi:AcrR family transcriptional regulator|nr:TetR/AcrR family transcriptional regulator [Steroidobacteraceae bacterium]
MKRTAPGGTRVYRQQARAAAAEDTSRRIIGALMECNSERWFDDITLDEVAQRAGVTKQTVIRRFKSKEGLLAALIKVIPSQIRTQREVAPGDVDAAIERVFDLYEGLGDAVIRNLAQESRFAALRSLIELGRREHRMITANNFAPHLSHLRKQQQQRAIDALVIATDVYTWKLLRRDMRRTRPEATVVMAGLVRGVLTQFAGADVGTGIGIGTGAGVAAGNKGRT